MSSMRNVPSVAIIILNWNRPQDTIECIDSVKKIDYKNYKIILVDNGSKDDSVKILSSKYPEIHIIKNEKNYGFAKGVNIGITYALREKPDYLLLLNNDTIVEKSFLSELVKVTHANRKIGIASSIIYYNNSQKLIYSFGGMNNFKGHYPFIDYKWHKVDTDKNCKAVFVDNVIGCSMLIHRDVFNSTGLFDTEYFLYVEDVDFCFRTKKNGYQIVVVPRSKVWHKISASSGGEGNQAKDYYNNRNLILFARKTLTGKVKYLFLYYTIKGRAVEIFRYFKAKKFKKCVIVLMGITMGLLGFKNK